MFGTLWNEPREHLVLPTARTMVRTLFFAGHERVIFDSVNTTRALRDFWKPSDDLHWDRTYHVVPTDADTCRRRAVQSDRKYLIGVIDRFEASYESVGDDEYGGDLTMLRGEEAYVPQAQARDIKKYIRLLEDIQDHHQEAMRELEATGHGGGDLPCGLLSRIGNLLQ